VSAPAVARVAPASLARVLVFGSYVVLGLLLLWSRLYGLGRGGFCCDEILTVTAYVREGPREILAGAYLPNNHQLFSLLGWAVSALVGESEVALRLGAAIPFVVGVAIVTVWLHARVDPLSGILFLALATLSPLLLDLSRQARGYGLAFLAMSLVTVGALEAARSDRLWPVIALCVGGVVGTLTLPHFVFAFLAVVAVLALARRRRALLVGLALTLAAVAAWWAPHVHDVAASASQDYGARISTLWIVTSPSDHVLVPGLWFLDETLPRPGLVSIALLIVFAVVVAASPLIRSRPTASILVAPVVVTIGVFWFTATSVAPRFFSFLLVPLLVLVATGAAAILGDLTTRRSPIRAACALAVLLVPLVASATLLTTVPRQPRESMREVARAISALGAPRPEVFGYVFNPGDLEFHLGRLVTQTRTSADVAKACSRREPVVFVTQIWMLEPLTPPCAGRPGTRHLRFEQYARGGAMDLWVIPARAEPT
jgi:hypothetical protein